jgi:hypothetical protein
MELLLNILGYFFVQPLFCALNFCTGIFHGKFDLFLQMSAVAEVAAAAYSYKCDRLRDSWLTGITRSAGSCNLVTLSTNFAQYKNFVCC